MTKVAWTDAHRREAWLYLLAMVARVRPGGPDDGQEVTIADADVDDELGFVQMVEAWLTTEDDPPRKVDRVLAKAVRRVDGLATGRLVRETEIRYIVRQPGQFDKEFGTWPGAKSAASQRFQATAHRVRANRIRRA